MDYCQKNKHKSIKERIRSGNRSFSNLRTGWFENREEDRSNSRNRDYTRNRDKRKKNRLHFFDGNSDRVSTEHFNRGTPTKWKSLS